MAVLHLTEEERQAIAYVLDIVGPRPHPTSGMVAWPIWAKVQYNACTEPCDMWTGPCACGACHKDGK